MELGLEFSELVLDGVPGQGAQVVDEELAVEVIGLMLHGAAEEVLGIVLDKVAREIEGLGLDLPGAADLGIEAREAQAAFLILDRGVALDDLGIDEDELLVLLLRVGRQVEDEEAK